MIARRSLLMGLGGLATLVPVAQAADARKLGLKPDAQSDQTTAFQKALREAANVGEPLHLPAGTYNVADVELPDGIWLQGVPGRTRLKTALPGPVLKLSKISRASLSGLVIEGPGRSPVDDEQGLIQAEDVRDLSIENVSLTKAPGSGIRLLRCGGRLHGLDLDDVGDTGIFSLDAVDLMIESCSMSDIGNNGIQVWRSKVEWDGTILRGNHIRRVRADGGGTGQNGNAINLFRAAGVIVSDTQAADCAYSAVRANACSDVSIRGTVARNMGEIAIYVEFGFSGAVVVGNLVDKAGGGISITNFNDGGRLATVQGNMIRNMFKRPHPETGELSYGFGIAAEADTAVTGNVIEQAAGQGITLGWGEYLRDVMASQNLIRNCDFGIGVSIVEGVGRAVIAGNMISGAKKGSIVGFAWNKPQTADLALDYNGQHSHLTLSQNVSSQ